MSKASRWAEKSHPKPLDFKSYNQTVVARVNSDGYLVMYSFTLTPLDALRLAAWLKETFEE